MKHQLYPGLEFFSQVFNALPSPLFVVDEDVRILYLNSAASEALGRRGTSVYMQRGGEALHCIHDSEHPGGCGHAPACADCVIRNSVTQAFHGGKVVRTKTGMTIARDNSSKDTQMLVTASPFEFDHRTLCLLILEDITELLLLRGLLPICAWCKKIRTDENYWQSLEEYFQHNHALQFTHGLCEDCCRKHYSELDP